MNAYSLLSLLIFTFCSNLAAIECRALSLQSNDSDDVTPFMRAARDGEYDSLKSMLRQGVDVNAKDSWGWSALIYACAKGNPAAVKDLISHGADVNAADNNGYTPLMVAVQYKHSSIVKLLLSNGADVNAEDKQGSTALTRAARMRDKKIIELLRNAGGRNPKQGEPPAEPFVEKAGDNRPELINRPTPSYTMRAREEKVEGAVRLRILIGRDGIVKKVRVLVGLPYGLSNQAMDAASKMRFKPATKGGEPVEFWQAVDIEFQLRR